MLIYELSLRALAKQSPASTENQEIASAKSASQ
jgi:hypothetical protein